MGEGGGGGRHRQGERGGGGQGGQQSPEGGGVEGEGEGVGGDREADFREQGEIRALLPATLQEGVQGVLVILSTQL